MFRLRQTKRIAKIVFPKNAPTSRPNRWPSCSHAIIPNIWHVQPIHGQSHENGQGTIHKTCLRRRPHVGDDEHLALQKTVPERPTGSGGSPRGTRTAALFSNPTERRRQKHDDHEATETTQKIDAEETGKPHRRLVPTMFGKNFPLFNRRPTN